MDQSEKRELAQRLRCKSLRKLSALSFVAGFGATLNAKLTGNALLDVVPVQWDVEDGRHRNAAGGACNQHSTRSLAVTADIQSSAAVSSARADFTLAVTARSATFVQLCVAWATHETDDEFVFII